MPRTLVLEIGCEELPTSFLDGALAALATLVPEELGRARIRHGAVRPLGTARRIAVAVADVADEIEAVTDEILGPPEGAARDKSGAWSKAAEGFARKNEVAVDDLAIVETPKGRYLRALKLRPGGPAFAQLAGALAAVIRRIPFAKSMRWADIETPFGRPVQWLVALFGDEVVPVQFVGVTAGRVSRGHRFLAPAPVTLARADDYVDALREAHVLVVPGERLAAQATALHAAARAEGGELVRNDFLDGEVVGLVEAPFVVAGHFDAAFLALPEELVETVMSHHQRYFAVRRPDGGLLPVFLTVTNTALDPGTIRKGNESVMRARLSDARFFVEQDRHSALEARVANLDGVVYHPKLGSYGDKVRRLAALAPWVAAHLGADEAMAAQAARLAKTDLVSLAVGEFPELQGIMGRFYARAEGLPAPVCDAIAEQYLPRGAEDPPAPSRLGAALAIADRLDTLVGFFAIGQKPSGGGDPFGLRRAALGLLRTLVQHRARFSLANAAGRALSLFTRELPRAGDETGRELADFLRERLEGLLGQRFEARVVAACLAAGGDDPVDVLERVEALAHLRATPAFERVATAFERVFNISREYARVASETPPDWALLTAPAERALIDAYRQTAGEFGAHVDARRFVPALELVAARYPEPIDRFFTEVFVMVDDAALRAARLHLLATLAREVGAVARFDTLRAV